MIFRQSLGSHFGQSKDGLMSGVDIRSQFQSNLVACPMIGIEHVEIVRCWHLVAPLQ